MLANFISRKSFADMEGVNFGEFKMNSANFNEVIERSRAIKFSYIDISKVLCPQDTCLSRDQYGSFYSDNTHFSDYGQRIVIKPLIEDIILKNNLQNPG